jgi:hypothetical protein
MANNKNVILMVAAFHFAADGMAEKMKKHSHYREIRSFLALNSEVCVQLIIKL